MTEASDSDADLEQEQGKRSPWIRGGPAAPRIITMHVAVTSTWRAYCSRPGVSSCQEYDQLEDVNRPPGDTVDFSPQVPYAGFGFGADIFPAARLKNPLRGLGVVLAYSQGFSLTNVRVQTPAGDSAPEQVISVDRAWMATPTYRYYFDWTGISMPGPAWMTRVPAYVGLRAGLAARSFEVDPTKSLPLPGSNRRYLIAAVDVSVPIVWLFRPEASFTYFINPRPGPDEIAGYGEDIPETRGSGWALELGASGDFYGPVGGILRVKISSYRDTFVGRGGKWLDGGAAQETYTGLYGGVTASF